MADALTLEQLAAMVAELIRDVATLKTRVEALVGSGGIPMSIGGPMQISVGQTSTCSIVATANVAGVDTPTTNLPALPVWVATNPLALTVTPSADSLTCTVAPVVGFPAGDAGSVHLVVGSLTDDLAVQIVAAGVPVADKVQISFTKPA